MSREIAFVDRDGTVNVDRGYVHRDVDWEFVKGAPQALKALCDGGYGIALITNQSAVARGFFTLQDVSALHDYVRGLLADEGVSLDAIAVCPHAPDEDCPCRKPATGLAGKIEASLGEAIDYANSWTFGDKLSDMQFGQALGTHTALIQSRYWTQRELLVHPDIVADSLASAARQVLWRGERSRGTD